MRLLWLVQAFFIFCFFGCAHKKEVLNSANMEELQPKNASTSGCYIKDNVNKVLYIRDEAKDLLDLSIESIKKAAPLYNFEKIFVNVDENKMSALFKEKRVQYGYKSVSIQFRRVNSYLQYLAEYAVSEKEQTSALYAARKKVIGAFPRCNPGVARCESDFSADGTRELTCEDIAKKLKMVGENLNEVKEVLKSYYEKKNDSLVRLFNEYDGYKLSPSFKAKQIHLALELGGVLFEHQELENDHKVLQERISALQDDVKELAHVLGGSHGER